MSVTSRIGGFFRILWRGLDRLRRLLHLILLLFIFAVIMLGVLGEPVKIPGSAALLIDPVGPLVEQLEGDPFDRALGGVRGEGIRQTLLKDVVDSLDAAATDTRIKVVVLRLEELEGGGLPKLQAITRAIGKVRAAGKKVIALGDAYDQNQYYLAAHADEVYLNDLGVVYIDGYGYYRTFFKGALDKLKIDLNVFRVGEYKSFVEPYIRDSMSDEDKAASDKWLRALWAVYQRDVVAARKLQPGSLDNYANEFISHLQAAQGNAAQTAVDQGLVDALMSRQQFRDYMVGLVGEGDDEKADFSSIDFRSYVRAIRQRQPSPVRAQNVGVIVASGTITDGQAPPGTVGGDTLAALVRQAATDDSIKAVVLRVDSPGGSMFASEVVFDELEALKGAGKPLVVSMGTVAASGGYYISMLADEIWANESTITGSIGVGAIIPTLNRGMDSLGVHVDGIGTTNLSGQLRLDRPLGQDARAFLDQSVQQAYRVFVTKVSASRKLTFERADEIARGRVWIGSDAHDRGLVDSLGDLPDALDAAAGRAGLKAGEYGIKYVEPELSVAQRIALQLASRGSRTLAALGFPISDHRPSWLHRVLGSTERQLTDMARLNDPRSLYVHCWCEAP
jgi:protease-4